MESAGGGVVGQRLLPAAHTEGAVDGTQTGEPSPHQHRRERGQGSPKTSHSEKEANQPVPGKQMGVGGESWNPGEVVGRHPARGKPKPPISGAKGQRFFERLQNVKNRGFG